MTFATSSLRAVGALSAGLLALGMLAACTPEPEPKPTKTALFASDEEAFAAAEETYGAYTDALNSTDISDASTFEPVYSWNTGTALASEKEALTLYHAEELTRTGDSTFDSFEPLTASNVEVVVQLCIDVSAVDLLRSDGSSALPEGRLPRAARKVTFKPGPTTTGLRIASNHEVDEGFTC
ncbi:hypothetical protein QF046_003541 [Microbacterium sp. W4I4]|uniref:hypothetical protein n=1 Tax=Microbacterium sp. W4I4 TaxID=3042295 RepID=UPI0027894731|nr:hypothetical protein [Microbacterium sp. W4I4]MDQ0615900.1 hypothetical protein [Microbacterium sp. W4I4]